MTDTDSTDLDPHNLDPQAFRQFLLGLEAGPETLAQTRTRLDLRGLSTPLPPGCAMAEVQANGVACELLTPHEAQDGGLILYLHGGGYQLGSPRSIRHFAARLAEAASVQALVPEYRLAPEHPFPAAVEDAVAAYRWALEQRPGSRIAVVGDSAGGGLAIALDLAARAKGLASPAAIYAISPWTDLAGGGPSRGAKAESDIYCSILGLEAMASAYLAGADPRSPLASPVYGEMAGLPPLLIHVGSEEILLSDSLKLAEQAALAKAEVRLEVFPEMLHSFPIFHDRLAAARRAITEAGAWLAERLR